MNRIMIMTILIIVIIGIFSSTQIIPEWQFDLMSFNQTANAAEFQNSNIYLPITLNRYPLSTKFGIEIKFFNVDEGIPQIKEIDPTWLRYNGLLWSIVEEAEGLRNWTLLSAMEQRLIKASSSGLKIIMIVRSTPTWAQKTPGAFCGPIKPDKLTNFGDFMYEAVSRYSKPPYNIKYWEIWNEPDVPYTGSNGDSVWGCWGDTTDPYYGGEYYAEMLKAVYPKIKAADPSANVLLGGLLLDCDPRPDSNWCAYWKHDERPPKFLEGILINGGGAYFDGISFHGYDYFDFTDPQLGEYLNPVWGSSWNGVLRDGTQGDRIGPVTIYKAEYIEFILNKYHTTGKFLMNTESAVLCGLATDPEGGPNCEPDDNSLYEQTKARYLTQAYTSALAKNLGANIWFSLYGWRNSALLNEDQSPRPAYYSYKVAREELANAEFVKEYTYNQNVKVYEFQRSNRIIWVVWSIDGGSHTITLPSTPDLVKDYMGVVKTPSSTFTATLEPHYLIWYP